MQLTQARADAAPGVVVIARLVVDRERDGAPEVSVLLPPAAAAAELVEIARGQDECGSGGGDAPRGDLDWPGRQRGEGLAGLGDGVGHVEVGDLQEGQLLRAGEAGGEERDRDQQRAMAHGGASGAQKWTLPIFTRLVRCRSAMSIAVAIE